MKQKAPLGTFCVIQPKTRLGLFVQLLGPNGICLLHYITVELFRVA